MEYPPETHIRREQPRVKSDLDTDLNGDVLSRAKSLHEKGKTFHFRNKLLKNYALGAQPLLRCRKSMIPTPLGRPDFSRVAKRRDAKARQCQRLRKSMIPPGFGKGPTSVGPLSR